MDIQITKEEIKDKIIPEIVKQVKNEIIEEVKQIKWNVREELKKEILQQHFSTWSIKDLSTEFKELLNKEIKEALNSLIENKIKEYINSEKRNIDYCIMKAIDEKANKILSGYIFVHSSALP